MNIRMTWATSTRVLAQLRHDHRSVALILVVPALLLTAVYFLYDNETLPPGVPRTFDRVGLMMLAIFPFVVMFLVTSITMLRERTSGTLERLLTTPIHKADLLFGYALAFSIMAALQSLVATAVAYWVFNLDIQGSPGLVVMIAVINAVLGVALGLLCSAFARTEFQAVQFMPVVVVPQILLCGLFVARDDMNPVLDAISGVLPLTFSVDALKEIAGNATATEVLWQDTLIMGGIVLVVLVLGSLTLRRQTR
ncbi:ABC-2 type transport system permease protein [Paenarthrobacter ilicis]|uniref:Transport permease protein n=2 Tax=Paenarthrobacter ilicis TaxID=43665 RepID=A0ABX0TF04_9MICC|nr:ABC-2 type transport system permease protein [Paenarthrobacter ilicis]NIJ01102.1 ABC-2 type transport system permease protein [Paenarthrobacter ilicis]